MMFYLTITVSSPRRDADVEERRDDPEERDVEVEKRGIDWAKVANKIISVVGK